MLGNAADDVEHGADLHAVLREVGNHDRRPFDAVGEIACLTGRQLHRIATLARLLVDARGNRDHVVDVVGDIAHRGLHLVHRGRGVRGLRELVLHRLVGVLGNRRGVFGSLGQFDSGRLDLLDAVVKLAHHRVQPAGGLAEFVAAVDVDRHGQVGIPLEPVDRAGQRQYRARQRARHQRADQRTDGGERYADDARPEEQTVG